MAKFERILNLFPAFYNAVDSTKLLYKVVELLAQPIEESDTHLFRIQRSHRLTVAEHVEDIILLAASLNLTAYDFEDILEDESLDYDQKRVLMRQRVRRIAGLHLDGLGTSRAVMECAVIFLNANIVSEKVNDPLIRHLDEEGYSHRATIEFSYIQGKPRNQIYLYENPLRRKKVSLAERYPLSSWWVENKNVIEPPVRVVIKGVGERTVLPCIFCPQTGEGILFNGIIPSGSTLVIDEMNGALLEHKPVDDWITFFKGGVFDFSKVNGSDSNFVVEQHGSSSPFDFDLEKISSRPFQKKRPTPKAPSGSSEWYFNVAEGVYDKNKYDFSVYAIDHEPIGEYDGNYDFDQCVFDHLANGIVGMAWDERIPCAFKLLLPAHIPTTRQGKDEDEGQSVNYVSRVGNILHRFKAAGVQYFVDKAKDGWILGASVIRKSAAADGEEEGMMLHATRLYGQKADQYVEI